MKAMRMTTVAISRDSEVFLSGKGVLFENIPEELLEASQSFLAMDPPRHTLIRKLVHAGFPPRQVGRIEDSIHTNAAEIVTIPAGRFEGSVRVDDLRVDHAVTSGTLSVRLVDADHRWRHPLIGDLFECVLGLLGVRQRFRSNGGSEFVEYRRVGAPADIGDVERCITLLSGRQPGRTVLR